MASKKPSRHRVNRHALMAFRTQAKLTQQQLAGLAGANHTWISHLERGSRFTCSAEKLDLLAEALGVPATALRAAE